MLTVPSSFQNANFVIQFPYEVDLAHVGIGHWRAFRALGVSLPEVMDIARGWAASFAGIDRPWLCWHVDDDWSLVQQRLVTSVGWTPVVGFDPRGGCPRRAVRQAVVMDFNRELGLPVLHPHFPLEFAFLYCSRIAFWHSDLLMREETLREAASIFAQLEDGQTAAVIGWGGLRQSIGERFRRYWELLGCTTRAASRDQFEKGCGWWMGFWAHPNQTQAEHIRRHCYWDHGSGIYYWHRHRGGKFRLLSNPRYQEGHFTKIGNPNYKRLRRLDSGSEALRMMPDEIKENFDLVEACKSLSIETYL
ncbi:MAG: hypothetical protein ACREFO_13990 [Acetobacteraceae bacterium]